MSGRRISGSAALNPPLSPPPPPGAPEEPTLPSTLKLRTMFDAGWTSCRWCICCIDRSCTVVARLGFCPEGTPQVELRRKSTFIFLRNILRSKVAPSCSPPGPLAGGGHLPRGPGRPGSPVASLGAEQASRRAQAEPSERPTAHLGRSPWSGDCGGRGAGAGRSPEGRPALSCPQLCTGAPGPDSEALTLLLSPKCPPLVLIWPLMLFRPLI